MTDRLNAAHSPKGADTQRREASHHKSLRDAVEEVCEDLKRLAYKYHKRSGRTLGKVGHRAKVKCLSRPEDAGGYGELGMTLRDYFAGQALQTMALHPEASSLPREITARTAYWIADAMLKAREEE